MRYSDSMLAETTTPTSWFSSFAQCCGAREKSSIHSAEKPFAPIHEAPAFVPPLPAQAQWPQERPYAGPQDRKKASGRKRSASREAISGKKGWFSSSTPRRPQISAPSNFRHLYSGAYQFAPVTPPRRPRPASFRPLELSMYLAENQVSPILPHFGDLEDLLTPPPPARTHSNWDSSSATLTPERSYSTMSFHHPRRRNTNDSAASHSPNASPPSAPPQAQLGTPEDMSSPGIGRMLERIANAMNERDRLQDEIDSVLERQTIYVRSRPTSAYEMYDIEPVPSIPALPAAAPSFAERLSTDSHSRPQTAPSQPTVVPKRDNMSVDGAIGFGSRPRTPPFPRVVVSPAQVRNERPLDVPLAPPLPLVLRPPLRKKKSFSRVSNWLFPGDGQQGGGSIFDSVTNDPRPVTDRDGFYAPIEGMTRTSVDTVSSVSSWESEEEEERQTVPTTAWSPGSSPTIKQETPKPTNWMLSPDVAPMFEQANNAHRPTSVGVAF